MGSSTNRRNQVVKTPSYRFCEQLEARQMLAADLFVPGFAVSPVANSCDLIYPARQNDVVPVAEGEGEGESAADLVAFAQQLSDLGVQLFGASWSPQTSAQRALFEDGSRRLPFVEVTNPDRSLNEVGIAENITSFPTWSFPDGSRLIGVQTLEAIAQQAEIAIPQSSEPFLFELPNVSVAIGSPLHIPLDAYDPNGAPLTISVQSSNPDLIAAELLTGNRSWRISTDFGDMVFELFEQRAPRPSARVIELSQAGFYDDVAFHRVVSDFVIQGGDPTGTGSGGSTLGAFDDQFHLDLQHNTTGVLSYAKSSDDTNDSQFFITDRPVRHLDYNHSVFGQLVEGEAVREAINGTATSSSRPVFPIRMNSATVFEDTENGVVMLKPTGNGTGSATITVTVTNSLGLTAIRTFEATVVEDTVNGLPFLNPIEYHQGQSDRLMRFSLSSQDEEGDPVTYSVTPLGPVNFGLQVDAASGVVTITPPAGYQGILRFGATVRPQGAPLTSSVTDNQRVAVGVNFSQDQSLINRFDVNSDGSITGLDVLTIINYLNAGNPNSPSGELSTAAPFLDVSGDRLISALDVSQLITEINQRASGGSGGAAGEGEADDSEASTNRANSLRISPAPLSNERRKLAHLDEALMQLSHEQSPAFVDIDWLMPRKKSNS